ncbi:MAG TPA: zinc-ribbon domain-containing protein [Candidatus Limnocylindrales bacterium]|nr:zinc-ribbon domain-containing protein [Candidatus Limnocylindrales bacterium]
MTYCTKCGTMNQDNAVFCQRCGAQLPSTQNMQSPQPAPGVSAINNYYYGRLRHRHRGRLSRDGQATPSEFAEKEVIKEIVLIPCHYCGALMPQTSTVCPNCGATRKA